jgi:hypothetical protein
MRRLAEDLNTLADAPQKGAVTRAEAAQRIQLLAARAPTFIVLISEGGGQRRLSCYLASSSEEQGAIAEAERALRRDSPGELQIEVALARRGVVQVWGGAPGE